MSEHDERTTPSEASAASEPTQWEAPAQGTGGEPVNQPHPAPPDPQPALPGPPAAQEPQTWATPQTADAAWRGPAMGYGGGGHHPTAYPSGPPPWAPPPAGPPPPPGFPTGPTPVGGLPVMAPPARSGVRAATVLLMIALMGLSAVAGGAIGAWTYAQTGSDGDDVGGVNVVDAPQLDYTSLASIASQVSPSVVQIRAGEGSGSGVVMSGDGHILTNAHVVAVAPSDEVSVQFSNGDTASATIVGTDERSDIAVVQVVGASDLSPAAFGDSDQALVGDTVLAIGSPLGFQGSVTQGIISARDRTLPVGSGSGERRSLSGLIQTDASINPGNSGGPLVNLAGEVVGINTAIATDGDVSSGFLGLGFAVPSNRATDVAEQLIAGDQVRHAYLGVSVTTVETGGALIGEIAPGSPAADAGLREGDIVVRVNNQTVTDSSDLVNIVQSSEPGDTLTVQYERGGSRQDATVILAEAGD